MPTGPISLTAAATIVEVSPGTQAERSPEALRDGAIEGIFTRAGGFPGPRGG